MMLGLGIYLIAYIRLAFIFPAIAIGRYAGIPSCLEANGGKHRSGSPLSLFLSYLPYWIFRQAFEWYMGYHPPGVVEAFRGCIEMLLIALASTALAAPALAYKAIVMDQPKNEGAVAIARRRPLAKRQPPSEPRLMQIVERALETVLDVVAQLLRTAVDGNAASASR